MLYDKFGRAQNTVMFQSLHEPAPYQVDTRADGTIFIRFYATTPCAVHRITTNGTVKTVEIAFGDWEQRETLTYQPVNQIFETED